jgi:hypothetical protein
MIGYEIGKTLSEHGSVSRGVCKVDETGNLQEIVERTQVYKEFDVVVYEENTHKHPLDLNTRVSMNFWGFTPEVFIPTVELFQEFALANKDNPKSEFFIPLVADALIRSQKADFKVIPTDSRWFGVTYKEDKPFVQENIDQLVKDGVYPENLWN